MDDDVFTQGETLLRKIDKISKFGLKYRIYPYQEAAVLVDELRTLAETLPEIETPANHDELMQSELKRKLIGGSFLLEQTLTPRPYDFETMISLYAIPISDISSLGGWLSSNKEATKEAINRLFKANNFDNYELDLRADIPSVKRQAEEFAAVHIQRYHKRVGRLLQDLTKVGDFLRDISAVPTTEGRSYFNPMTSTLAIGIPAICYSNEDGTLRIRERDLIRLYGHEGMGHALNQVITKNNGLPFFLTKDTHLTSATMESVAQFYQEVIFEDLYNSPEAQKDLEIMHIFPELYQESKDISLIEQFNLKFFQYAVTVIADKSLGHPNDPQTIKNKIEILERLSLDPKYPTTLVEQYRASFDSQGNLNPSLVGELRYCAQPVQRALEEFAKQGMHYDGPSRSRIDSTLLTGFWSPIGYVHNARLNAQEK